MFNESLNKAIITSQHALIQKLLHGLQVTAEMLAPHDPGSARTIRDCVNVARIEHNTIRLLEAIKNA